MNLFKKLSPKPQNEAVPKSIITNYSYGEIPVEVEYNIDASMERLPYDFETLKKEGIDNIIKEINKQDEEFKKSIENNRKVGEDDIR